jgi:hypothetical protein
MIMVFSGCISQAMNCAIDRTRARARRIRQQRRFGMGFFQIFQDGQRLADDNPVVIKRRHDHLWIDRRIILPFLSPCRQVNTDTLPIEALQVQGNSGAIRGR